MNRVWRKVLLLATLVSLFAAPLVHAADIVGVRLWRAPDNTRLVFDLAAASNYQFNSGSRELTLTVNKSQLRANTQQLALANTPIERISTRQAGSDLIITLTLKASVSPKHFTLPANDKYGHRLVLDLYDQQPAQSSKPKAVKPAATGGLRDIIIAVDAGHGGEDPGAIGPGKLYEKRITLEIAKELAAIINATPGYTAVLTRTGDYFISLRGRTKIAREKGADLFISIHADAFTDSRARGAGVFALSQKGATSETARWLAQKENESDLVGGVNLGEKDPVLKEVLLDWSMTATVATSLDMGDKVLKSMGKMAKLHRGYVEQAGFAVLKNPDIPSLLIEAGFITNHEEAKNLASSAYRKKMARHIFTGIDSYFRAKPPMDTALAAARGGKVTRTVDPVSAVSTRAATSSASRDSSRSQSSKPVQASKPAQSSSSAKRSGSVKYKVKAGDTLHSIARKHGVKIDAIKKHNKLPASGQVNVGQTLTIPAN